jgi:phosphate transport system permease protein
MSRLLVRMLPLFSWLCVLGTLMAVAALIGFLLWRGGGILGLELFFGVIDPLSAITGRVPVWEGIWPAFLGTLSLLVLSIGLALPFGIGCGIYLAEYAGGRSKRCIDFFVDLLAGIPSVVMGLFGFALILLLRRTFVPQANTCLLLAASCLALLILPYLISTTRSALEGLSRELRLIAPSLGLSRWQAIRHVLLPASSRSMLSGIVLSMGRAAEDTAVILLTGVVANAGAPRGLTDKFEALPFEIFYLAAQYQNPAELDRGFGSALVLLCLTGSFFCLAHVLHRSLERKWTIQL